MNNTLRNTLLVVLGIALAAGLFYGGMVFGSRSQAAGYGPYGMMGGYAGPNGAGSYGYGPGMMSGGGMMGGYGYGGLGSGKPLSVADARSAVEAYLTGLGNDDLAIKEIMIFDNGAYAIVMEKSTGVGAFELLIDPVGPSVFPEYGPNMMWNLKYGMTLAPAASAGVSGAGGSGMMGGGAMMRGWYGNNVQVPDVSAEMPVSAAQASVTAQKYLDSYLPGLKVSDEIMPFYGYYTIDVERDGKIAGMLGVNGYTRQVFLHTWHGDYIESGD